MYALVTRPVRIPDNLLAFSTVASRSVVHLPSELSLQRQQTRTLQLVQYLRRDNLARKSPMTLASHSLIWWSASGTSARPVELAVLAATLEYTETLDSDKKRPRRSNGSNSVADTLDNFLRMTVPETTLQHVAPGSPADVETATGPQTTADTSLLLHLPGEWYLSWGDDAPTQTFSTRRSSSDFFSVDFSSICLMSGTRPGSRCSGTGVLDSQITSSYRFLLQTPTMSCGRGRRKMER